MSKTPKILAFAGSTRKDSWNKKLLKEAAEAAHGAGAEVTVIDLADYPLPLYDGNLEAAQGLPENVKKLQKLFAEHDGFLIASPDYNGSYSAVLKNTVDWLTRKDKEHDPPLEPFKGKIAVIMSASPGALGGLRGLEKLHDLLDNLQVMVLPDVVAVGGITTAFNEAGKLSNPKTAKSLETAATKLVTVARKLAP
ncbi:MAG: NADPH-dependent FMN reductase [Alphaproteobacteria bacterium]